MADFVMMEGDTGVAWLWTLTDSAGNAEDYSSGSVTIDILKEYDNTLTVDSSALTAVTDGSDGAFSWTPSSAEVAALVHGHYKAQVTHIDGTAVTTHPRNTGSSKYKTLEVLRRLDNVPD